jgi:hypothetical protein
VVTYLIKIKVGHFVPWTAWGTLGMDCIEAPVYFRPIVDVLISKKIESVPADPLRALDGVVYNFGKPLA